MMARILPQQRQSVVDRPTAPAAVRPPGRSSTDRQTAGGDVGACSSGLAGVPGCEAARGTAWDAGSATRSLAAPGGTGGKTGGESDVASPAPVLVSGAGHDALAMAELTKVRQTSLRCFFEGLEGLVRFDGFEAARPVGSFLFLCFFFFWGGGVCLWIAAQRGWCATSTEAQDAKRPVTTEMRILCMAAK
jgi:hypothetical protein